MTVLRIDTSARTEGSVTRQLLDRIEAKLGGTVVRRDLGHEQLPHVSDTWVGGAYIADADRTPEHRAALAKSDEIVAEVHAADTLLIALPIYNFSVPASLKAWIDLVARANVTFRYTETGPVGLLEGKRAIVAVASGGTGVGSDVDYATGYLRHFLGFIGITDVEFVTADQLMMGADDAMAKADRQIEALAA